MTELGNNTEHLHEQPQTLDMRIDRRDYYLGPSINVPNEMLAVYLWDEMVQKTQATGREFGAVASSIGNRILTSKIFEGFGERHDYDTNGKHPPSFHPPLLPHGLRSLHPGMKDFVLVHTHPMPTEVDHLPTTAMSEEDILAYASSSYNALVMIDKGGVHMLTGRDPYSVVRDVSAKKIVSDALTTSKNNSSTFAEVRAEMAKGLAPFHMRYYFAPCKIPTNNGYILFTDCAPR